MLGTGDATEMDESSEKFQRGGGGGLGGLIFNPKHCWILDPETGLIMHDFQKKIATWFSENEGDGQGPFGTFPNIHPIW